MDEIKPEINADPKEEAANNLPPQIFKDMPENKGEAIGGWLILVGLGMCLSIIKSAVLIFGTLWPVFTPEKWSVLTTPGGAAYHPLWAPMLIYELVCNNIILMFCIVLLTIFFKRLRLFPKYYIIFLIFNLVFVSSDYFLANLIPFVASQGNTDSLKEFIRTIINCAIWIPYFLRSARVPRTFVR